MATTSDQSDFSLPHGCSEREREREREGEREVAICKPNHCPLLGLPQCWQNATAGAEFVLFRSKRHPQGAATTNKALTELYPLFLACLHPLLCRPPSLPPSPPPPPPPHTHTTAPCAQPSAASVNIPSTSPFSYVTRSHEMSPKIWQFEISACLKSARSVRYFDTEITFLLQEKINVDVTRF